MMTLQDPPQDATKVTNALLRVSRDGSDAQELLPLVYDRLRALAGRWFRGAAQGATLQPTALVHEAWLHLVDHSRAGFADRAHFLAVAATAMRQILIQRARARDTAKRGGAWRRVELDPDGNGAAGSVRDGAFDVATLLAIEEALERLAQLNPRHAKVVEMRFFGGLTVEEVAAVLGVTTRTIELDWRAARAWLKVQLAGRDAGSRG